ncbi:MAG: type I glyceraldehyde-3-phosphate dehydrogenase [Deltaproteobacteria bacterium]|nr:type I glyceraldehyde-3-phosphate dehydrogenase [Candidatus Anaeroferrophillus wilburensis]MBN2888107.1 type I glyceraldehyde-3-phosphate dehydrogenase [Deltaproteobacteria bacterium]
MAAVRVAVNGFGRIGRDCLRAAVNDDRFDFRAIVSTIDDAKTMAHLLKYDSVSGTLDAEIIPGDKSLTMNGKQIQLIAGKDPKSVPWQDLGVDIVMECSGLYRDRDKAAVFLDAGVQRVVVSAPVKKADATIVMGVNQDDFTVDRDFVISNASCTTNCLAPVAKVLLENFGIKRGMMTTVHSYTRDQQILDSRHKDLRRARAAAMSMIPTTTGAAAAVGLVLPQLKGKLDGLAIRVPTPNVSLVDLVVEVEKETSADVVNDCFRQAADKELKGILMVSDEPLVSVDYNHNPHSSIVDAELTNVMDGTLLKVMSWYDNEWGYACRLNDLTAYVAKLADLM